MSGFEVGCVGTRLDDRIATLQHSVTGVGVPVGSKLELGGQKWSERIHSHYVQEIG